MPDAVDSIPSLVQRWRADSVSASDGAAVTSWAAQTGSVTLTAAASSATYRTAGIGGQPALSFAFANNPRFTGTVAGGYNTATFVLVLQPATLTSQRNIVNNGMEILADGTSYQAYNGSALVTGTTSTTAASVLTVVFDGTTTTIYRNGTLITSGSAGSGTRGTSMVLGGHPSLPARAFDGLIAEVMCFQAALTGTQRQTVDSYVQDRYGIAVSDYTSSGVTGAGALVASAATVSAAGTVTVSGAGTLTRGAPALAGSGTLRASGSGALTAAAPALSGAGTLALVGSGALTGSSPALTGTGVTGVTGEVVYTPHVYVTATLTGNGVSTAVLATNGTVTAVLAGNGTGTAVLLDNAATATLQTT